MDLYIDRDALARGLARVQNIVERRSTQPVLSHVLLFAQGETLRLTATDTQVAYVGELSANVTTPGELSVDAQSLHAIARALPEPTVHLKLVAGQRLEISSGRSSFKLPGSPASHYPPLPAFDVDGRATLEEAALLRMVDQTSFAVSPDDNRYGLNGAAMHAVGGDRVRMVATDSHRLAASEAVFEGELRVGARRLVPRKALGVLRRLLDPGSNEPVELAFGDGSMRLTRPGSMFWFRLIDGEFPEYERVLPVGQPQHLIRLRRQELVELLKRVGILMVAERVRAVRFAFDAAELTVSVSSADRGDIVESMPVELEGNPIVAGFNARYLADVLEVIDGEYVTLALGHALAPCIVRDPDRDDAFFVVMPMRLD